MSVVLSCSKTAGTSIHVFFKNSAEVELIRITDG